MDSLIPSSLFGSLAWSAFLLVLLTTTVILSALVIRQRAQLKQSAHDFNQSLNKLRRERQHTEKYLDATQTLMMALDREGRITMANRACCDVLGHPKNELLGRNWFTSFIPQPEGRDGVYPLYCRIMEGDAEPTEYFDNTVLCRDGTRRDIAWHNVLITDQSGAITGVLSSGEDVTDRKQVEKALGEAKAIRNTIFATLPDLIWLKDPDGLYLACNPAFERFFGAKEADIIGKTDHDFVDTELADLFRANDQAAVGAGGPRSNEEWVTFAASKHRALLLTTKTPMYDHHGEVTGVLGIARDITDRELAKEALQTQRQSLQNIIEGTRAGTWEWNVQSGQTMFNERWAEMLGYRLNELSPVSVQTWISLTHPEDLVRSKHLLEQYFAGKLDHYECELRMRHKNGGWVWLLDRGRIVERDENGKPLWMAGTHQDITERKRAEEALSHSEKSLREAQRIAHVGNWELDLVNNELNWSEEIYRIFEIDPQRFKASYEAFIDAVHPDDRDSVNQAYTESVNNRQPYQIAHRLLMKDGRIKHVHERCETFYDKDGAPLRSLGTVQDISGQKQLENELQLAASVFTHAREGITITDAEGSIIAVNDSFSQITGYSRDEAIGQNPRLLKSSRHDSSFYEDMWTQLTENGVWSGEIWNRRKNGEVYPELLTISAVYDDNHQTQHYVALFSDITAQKKYQEQLERIAHFDALTGLANRVLLADRLQQAMARAKRSMLSIAVVYLDLDGFKEINDSYGHEVGDQFLVSLASRMQQVLREVDTIARLGGDEFVTVIVDLPDTNDSIPMLNRLLASVAQPVQIDGHLLQVSASLGVAFYHYDEEIGVGADQLLRQADQAMYQAKLMGKNRYHFFDTEQDRNIRGIHSSLESIQNALSNREFILHYQPLVNMRTGELRTAEALIRWQHPERGLLPPDNFLPAVADNALDTEIGEWVIDSALSQVEQWREAGLDLPVSVNISAYQLQQPDFITRLHDILDQHPTVKPDCLELEILETSALADITRVSEVMNACKEFGVNFSLDDFGTGYSSLTYLKMLPSSRLKIDRSFVRDMLDDPDDLAILEGVLGLATAFRRYAVAEGVETTEQGEMLLRLGCELAQGYGIARPMPASDIPKWAAAWQPEPTWPKQFKVDSGSLPLLFACVEHRAWVKQIEAYLKGKRPTAPPLDDHQCRFSQWLNGEGKKHLGNRLTFQIVSGLHQKAHDLAADLIDLKDNGRGREALIRLEDLYHTRDSLLTELIRWSDTKHKNFTGHGK